jgi:hypothetical protein
VKEESSFCEQKEAKKLFNHFGGCEVSAGTMVQGV